MYAICGAHVEESTKLILVAYSIFIKVYLFIYIRQ